jgi:hypothetical protein
MKILNSLIYNPAYQKESTINLYVLSLPEMQKVYTKIYIDSILDIISLKYTILRYVSPQL